VKAEGPAPQVLEIQEHSTLTMPKEAFSEELANKLWRSYREQVEVQAPSFTNGYQWELTAKGWVGRVTLAEGVTLALVPKVPLGNLFGMLELAYNLDALLLGGPLVLCETLDDLYQRLAVVLARRVLDRHRKGLFREYQGRQEELSHLKGRMDLRQVCRQPWKVGFDCSFEEHSADNEDNQILAWTLYQVARSGVCQGDTLAVVRQAFLALRGAAKVEPQLSAACVGRLYHRLNQDYQPLHALCRFFLEHLGPGHQDGQHQMLPFLINMPRLFEVFVARWLEANLPGGVQLRAQETVDLAQGLKIHIDLVLRDAVTQRTLAVLDTKYKRPVQVANDDLYQAVAYAEAKGCSQAFLVYPAPLPTPLNTRMGKIAVRSLTFGLGGDLKEGGQAFLKELAAVLG
jgi:5-methylcytosine-specific restriction enzyme subunit McrC